MRPEGRAARDDRGRRRRRRGHELDPVAGTSRRDQQGMGQPQPARAGPVRVRSPRPSGRSQADGSPNRRRRRPRASGDEPVATLATAGPARVPGATSRPCASSSPVLDPAKGAGADDRSLAAGTDDAVARRDRAPEADAEQAPLSMGEDDVEPVARPCPGPRRRAPSVVPVGGPAARPPAARHGPEPGPPVPRRARRSRRRRTGPPRPRSRARRPAARRGGRASRRGSTTTYSTSSGRSEEGRTSAARSGAEHAARRADRWRSPRRRAHARARSHRGRRPRAGAGRPARAGRRSRTDRRSAPARRRASARGLLRRSELAHPRAGRRSRGSGRRQRPAEPEGAIPGRPTPTA